MPRGSSAIDHGTEPHHVPRFRSGFVRRGGLVERLINAKDAALALIVAPAGYGKSTLLSDWAEHDPRPFIWITTDDRDCAAPALFRSIAQAFADIGWSEPDGREPELLAPGRGARSALARLMRALGDRDYSFVLVLDGADAVDGATLRVVTSALLGMLTVVAVGWIGKRNPIAIAP